MNKFLNRDRGRLTSGSGNTEQRYVCACCGNKTDDRRLICPDCQDEPLSAEGKAHG